MNTYNVYRANATFLEEKNESMTYDFTAIIRTAIRNGKMKTLSVPACIDAYATGFQSSHGNLLLISAEDISDQEKGSMGLNPYYAQFGGYWETKQPFSWMCLAERNSRFYGPCDDHIPQIKNNAEEWRPFGSIVTECYSQETDERCKILFSTTICWVVVVINLIKSILMLSIAIGCGDEEPILTIGDAVASFLKCSDDTTTHMCLKSKRDFVHHNWLKFPRRIDTRPRKKFSAGSPGRWITCVLLYVSDLSNVISIWYAYILIGSYCLSSLVLCCYCKA